MLFDLPLPETKTTADLIAEKLRDAILQGGLKSGQALKQDVIAAELKVSKIPVREALHLLKQEGLVTIRPNRGAIVSELTFGEIEEIFAMRIALETTILQRAIPKLTPADIEKSEQILRQLDDAQSVAAWADLNWRFHKSLYEPAQQPRMMATIDSLHTNVGRYMQQTEWGDLDYLQKPQKEHWMILSYCRGGATVAAVNLLEEHLRGPIVYIEKFMADET